VEVTTPRVGTSKPPRIFFSVGEPSGDLHGANLIRALHRSSPGIRCEGFGGERMQEAGCELHFNLTQHSMIGFLRIISQIRQFKRLLDQATEHLQRERPDAVVLVDYPGFNWWMARRAKALGIPVYYFVPPQIWGWASWRVRKMRRFVDHVLCTLPFERPWYQARSIDAPYIGHPYFDALQQQTLDMTFVTGQQTRREQIIGILPGSRRQELENNFTSQLRAAAHIVKQYPGCRFLTACLKQEHADHLGAVLRREYPDADRGDEGTLESGYRGAWSLPLELCIGRTPEIIHLSHSCITVSGSVSLELLHAQKPAVTIYRASVGGIFLYHLLCNVKYVSLVNLLANQPLYPEYVVLGCPGAAMGEQILRWLREPQKHAELRQKLAELYAKVGIPGACTRAAEYILSTMVRPQTLAA
jgi:lipid-A-disaccharide synthase